MAKFEPLKLAGTWAIRLEPHFDDRGYLVVAYGNDLFEERGLVTGWVQDNESLSRRGVIRGLHFQNPPHAETKLVRVVAGAVWDVFVDLRRSSPTYGQWDAIELSEDNHISAYIPRGFAHGFCTLSDRAVVVYKVDRYYVPAAAGGVLWNDEALAIPWPLGGKAPLLSSRDLGLPSLRDLVSPF